MDGIIQKLTFLFERLPGIGPRQAKRFVYALLDDAEDAPRELASAILELKAKVKRCARCFKAFEGAGAVCHICERHSDAESLLVVERDVDMENIEKAGVYDGLFHVLGGSVSPLDVSSAQKLRLRELFNRVKDSANFKEVILATSATTEGDATAAYANKILEDFTKSGRIKITRLGRGLSSGTYLEYSDRDTLQNAFLNRK